jgi:hypothetical protein
VFPVEWPKQRNFTGAGIDPKQVGITLLEEVAHLIVVGRRVRVVRLHLGFAIKNDRAINSPFVFLPPPPASSLHPPPQPSPPRNRPISANAVVALLIVRALGALYVI